MAISREFDAPVTVLMSSLNDGSVSQSVLTVQGPLKPIRTTHFGYTHNHFLGDDSASDSIIIARSKTVGPGFIRFPGGNGAGSSNAAHGLDILSNGFKMRTSGGDSNQNTKNFIYMAWASNPFQANGGLAR